MTDPNAPVLWMDQDPARLERDAREVTDFAPGMNFLPPSDEPQTHGGWHGPIPAWPFARAMPDGVNALIGEPFEVAVAYPSAYPMTPPLVFPLNVTPEPIEHSQTVWHVSPSGMLCLLQSTGAWLPEASITELLLKAAGWRIEYALMKAGAVEQMSTNGIVSDDSLDRKISEVAQDLDKFTADADG